MRPKRKRLRVQTGAGLVWAALLGTLAGGGAGVVAAKPVVPPGEVRLDPANFVAGVNHPYFPLVPGTTFKLVENLGKNTSDIEVAVMAETRAILGVSGVAVRERVWEKGTLSQETLTWFAQDRDGNVWILGEDAREFMDRGRVSTEGSWEAGVDGAEPGIVMPGRAVPGEPYRHGYLAGVAEDRAQIVGMSESVTVPHGSFSGCLKTKEWSMLEAGTDKKWYARGVGLVRAESASKEITTLISVSRP